MTIAGTIGVDEAGRGAWAGSVVAAAVWWPQQGLPCVVGDSKRFKANIRAQSSAFLVQHTPTAIGSASVAEIDSLNILQANLLAMQRAVVALLHALPPHYMTDEIVVDGLHIPTINSNIAMRALVRGDALHQAVGAASMLAKYSRDCTMHHAHALYPQYGFAQHMGYGTAQHRAALLQHGLTPLHRRSFKPMCTAPFAA